MKCKITICRFIASLAAILFIAVAVYCIAIFIGAYRWSQNLRQTELFNIKVDLAKAGRYTTSYSQERSPHGPYFYIKSDGLPDSEEEALAKLEGLNAKISITDEEGGLVFEELFGAEYFVQGPATSNENTLSILLSPGGLSTEGNFKFVLNVLNPAIALQNHEQYIVAKYMYCGLEFMGGIILLIIGSISLCFGSIILIFLIVKGRKKVPIRENAAQGDTSSYN